MSMRLGDRGLVLDPLRPVPGATSLGFLILGNLMVEEYPGGIQGTQVDVRNTILGDRVVVVNASNNRGSTLRNEFPTRGSVTDVVNYASHTRLHRINIHQEG